ncbi:hypothetical protein ATI61_101469 [Archangium gephyra]|uniref:Transmembrane protein n=1 Tax=Archangium gephyra TaxID=48 RepID=A0AAC8THE1_9BACT|nr:YeeE/YedE family protein [Archangium gephyra]AKJ04441.1 Putative transmembrane protein [Archangium gephyra]REG37483.1 hypothetical protein ATI61_101469 [Archangium gephyra]
MTGFSLPLMGGVLIGLSASLLLLFNGRVAGISGIVGGLLAPSRGEVPWRLAFIAGLVGGGFLVRALLPGAFGQETSSPAPGLTVAAGLLVGLGTHLSNGCTSGHGVCGVSRGSMRSIVATLVFMATGALAVFVLRTLRGGVL